MFKLTDSYEFWFPIKVKIPHPEKAGKHVVQSFEVLFEALQQDEARDLQKRLDALPVDERAEHEHDLLRRVVKNWKGVVGTDDKEITFSPEAFHQALQFTWVRNGLYRAYSAALNGEAAAGN